MNSVEKIINFVRVDRLTNWEDIEAVVFFATPDVLSGLCTWAFYDNDAEDAVVTKFASGCAAIISFDTMARASLPPSKSTDICDDESFYNTLSNSL